jgi:hypothetical protein
MGWRSPTLSTVEPTAAERVAPATAAISETGSHCRMM